MASQNIAVPGALCGTLHHCLHKSPCFSGVAIIDEVSKIPLVLRAAIVKWQLPGARFICLGDFRSQFGPAFNRWRQETVDQCVEESTFFKNLCNCNRINFTTYRRGDNPSFSNYIPGWSTSLLQRVCAKSCNDFPRNLACRTGVSPLATRRGAR